MIEYLDEIVTRTANAPSAEILQELVATNEFQLLPVLGLFLFAESATVTEANGTSVSLWM